MLNWLKKFSSTPAKVADAPAASGKSDAGVVPDRRQESEAHKKRGNECLRNGDLARAENCYRQAVAIDATNSGAHVNLGFVLREQKRYDDAARHLKQAIGIDPAMVDAYYILATVEFERNELVAAIENFERALQLKPDFPEAHLNAGGALLARGEFHGAREHFRAAVEYRPDFFLAHSSLLFSESFDLDCSPARYVEEARRYGERALAFARPFTSWPATVHGRRPLRVGVVSGDLRNHPVGFFLLSVLSRLDRTRIELVAYPTQLQEDAITAQLKPNFVAWKPIANASEQEAAEMIHADGIQVLLDLAGHTAHNRLPVFAWKPAPVQASWLGHFASTGVPGMDYLLVDRVSAPPEHQAHFTETLWHLPDTRLCFTAPDDVARLAVTPTPALRSGHVTFGSFQNLMKINDRVIGSWGRILGALPDARLRIQNWQMNSAAEVAHLRERLSKAGIAPERVTIKGAVPREDYLAAHAEVDIILDTFPYPGATTTCEALWMGVPTITLTGETMSARQGAAFMVFAGQEEWIASSEQEYVAKALEFAGDIDRLERLRAGLRQRVLAAPLFDAPRFARHLEQAIEGMWNRKTGAGAKPAS